MVKQKPKDNYNKTKCQSVPINLKIKVDEDKPPAATIFVFFWNLCRRKQKEIIGCLMDLRLR